MPEIIFLAILCGYFLQSILFVIGAKKKFPRLNENKLPTATVIVAARDEEKNIQRCLDSLGKLEYPNSRLEVLIVDDRSTDKTGEIIDKFISNTAYRNSKINCSSTYEQKINEINCLHPSK